MKRVLSILLALALIVVFAGTLYYLRQKSVVKPVVYETSTPRRATIIRKAVATGSVVPRREVAIKPQVSGIIKELFVEAGEVVAEGDPIARIEIIPNMVTQANAESRVKRASIALADSERELERHRRLRRDGAVSDVAVQQAELAFANATEEISAAQNNLELIRKGTTQGRGQSSNTLVRSTIAGTVLEVPMEAGGSVIEANNFNDGTTLATIADMREIVFEGKVDESEVGKIQTGMALLLTIGALSDRTFDAKLEHIAPKGVEENGAIQFEIRAALHNSDGTLIRANLSANADIVLDRRDDVLAIDEALLQFDDGKPFVEIETSSQVFEKRYIETGLSDGILVEVKSGVDLSARIKNAAKAPPAAG